jgi:signal transduction histidine kinase
MTVRQFSYTRGLTSSIVEEHLLIYYHNFEELLIALCCAIIAARAFRLYYTRQPGIDAEQKSRIFLVGAAFTILALSSLAHAAIHAFHFDQNLLYQTLLGYCFGFLILIIAVSAELPQNKRTVPLFYLPLLVFFFPDLYRQFPAFGELRPLIWISVAYLSGVVCMLHLAVFYLTSNRKFMLSTFGFSLIFISSVFLFFPSAIGTPMWLYGHLLRPFGFIILLLSMDRHAFRKMSGSILYRAVTAFSLLAAIPFLIFGTVIFFETINPMDAEGKRFLIFILMLVTFISALLFGMGMTIRLIRPILHLKESVDQLADDGFQKKIRVRSNDEIGELSQAFNIMSVRLCNAIDEQERYCRLAATGELAATLAHELKNPLNAIGGAAAYIGKNYRGELIEEFVKIISYEVARINKLATNLLCFARPLTAEPLPNDVNKVVQETVSLLSKEALEQGIRLTGSLAGEMPPVICDHNQVKQVLINLIINAFAAIDGKGEVAISTCIFRDRVAVTVTDSGSGIRPEDLKHIFNPFFTTKTRGTGLGLAISKKIACEHGGDLTVASVYGKGSEFTLSLPLR